MLATGSRRRGSERMHRIVERLHGAAASLRDLLLPPQCVACGASFDSHAETAADGAGGRLQLCRACREQVGGFRYPACPRCLAPLPQAREELLACRYCALRPQRFSRALAIGPYEGLLRELVLRNKIDVRGATAQALAELAWSRIGPALAALAPDVVTAPPMTWRRRREHGFNPQAELARRIGKQLNAPVDPGLLRLKRDVAKQVGLSHAGRFANLQRAMEISRGRRLDAARVLVVDDILTSGATCSEAARALTASGAADVCILVMARTPPG